MSLHTTEYPRAQQDSSPDLGLSRSAFSSSNTTQTTRFEGDYRGILPFELEERIIDIIAAQVALSPSFERLWKSTLLSCALTCRAWAHRCRMHIFRFVSITTKTSFTNFLSFVSSKVAPLHSEVESIEARQSYPPHNETRFNHLVPHFLATRLPFVSHFILHDRGDKPCVHHPSIYIHLTQFKSITKLELHDHHFPCLNDTRRFICAFPSLVDVILNNVKWGTTANQRRILPKPLIRATKWTMMDLKVHFSGEISTAGLYFWILPPHSRGPLWNVGEQKGRRIHPGLSLRDALAMKGILDALEQEKYLLDFECFSQLGGWDLTVNAQQNDQIDYHWQHIATPTKTTNYILDKSPLCPTRALIHTLTITVSGNTLDKIHFDKLTSSLFELTELQKVTFIVQSLTFETEIDKTVKILEKQFQAARDAPNFKLTIIIQGRELFWPQPRSSPQWRIPLPTTPNLGSSISVRSEDPKMQSDADQKMARNLELKHYRALIADLLNRINRMQLHSKTRRLASS